MRQQKSARFVCQKNRMLSSCLAAIYVFAKSAEMPLKNRKIPFARYVEVKFKR